MVSSKWHRKPFLPIRARFSLRDIIMKYWVEEAFSCHSLFPCDLVTKKERNWNWRIEERIVNFHYSSNSLPKNKHSVIITHVVPNLWLSFCCGAQKHHKWSKLVHMTMAWHGIYVIFFNWKSPCSELLITWYESVNWYRSVWFANGTIRQPFWSDSL